MINAKLTQIRSFCFSSLLVSKSVASPRPIQADGCLSNPISTAIATSLQEYINSEYCSHGLKIHGYILKTGYQPNISISIKLLILHLKSGSIRYARQLLDEMPHRTLSAYNYLLNAYVKHDQVAEAFNLVCQMYDSGEKPDSFTLSLILKALSALPRPFLLACDIGRQVHAQIIQHDAERDIVLFASLIDTYVKSERLLYARRVFDFMLVKNVMCCTSLISGYMNNGIVEDAEALFRDMVEKDVVVFNAMIEGYSKSIDTAKKSLEIYIEMRRLDVWPTISTFASLIGACSLLTSVEFGQQLQSHLVKTRYFMHVKIGSALIDMYSKCGNVDYARQVFDSMPEKNIFTWTSMIDGYGKNGKSSEVIELFAKLQAEVQIKPNCVTFLCALSACAYAGLVDKSWEIFESMERDYSLKPQMEHYACMVDALGRSGKLQEAWEFVMRMPNKPNSDVWAALLSSCRMHGEVEMASIAADELFKLGADSRPGAYMALSNALAASGKWDSVNEIRELMKLRRISKDTGFSWTGSANILHAGLTCQ